MNKEHFGNVLQDTLKESMRNATNKLPGKLEWKVAGGISRKDDKKTIIIDLQMIENCG